jgi:hypothetical protein
MFSRFRRYLGSACTPETDCRIAHRDNQAGHRVRPACTAQQHRAPEPQCRTWVTPLTFGSRNDIREALKAFDNPVHAIEHQVLKTNPTNYGFLDNIGGVDSLLDVVERGLKSRDAQFGYFRSSHPPDLNCLACVSQAEPPVLWHDGFEILDQMLRTLEYRLAIRLLEPRQAVSS